MSTSGQTGLTTAVGSEGSSATLLAAGQSSAANHLKIGKKREIMREKERLLSGTSLSWTPQGHKCLDLILRDGS